MLFKIIKHNLSTNFLYVKTGYGEYFDEEDNKWLFYMSDFEKWFVADEV